MLTFDQVLDHEWLQGRYHLLELAAILDRLDLAAKGSKPAPADPRLAQLQAAITQLSLGGKGDRVERILRLYSDPVASGKE